MNLTAPLAHRHPTMSLFTYLLDYLLYVQLKNSPPKSTATYVVEDEMTNNAKLRWEELKRQIESHKQLTLTMNKNPAYDTCIYFLQMMERLEKRYPYKEEE